MNDNKVSETFRSYVDVEEVELREVGADRSDSIEDALVPKFLPGELFVAKAQNVLMLTPFSNNKQGISGTLTITNFKLSFITTDVSSKYECGYQQNLLLGEHEISLSNVDIVYQIIGIGGKKRRLSPRINLSGKVKGLQVVCKNMKVYTFIFKFSPIGQGKSVTNAILHHAFPARHQLLFAYDYREPSYHCPHEVCLFQDKHDWMAELQRSKCLGWRISTVNQSFKMSPNLPQYIIVPLEVNDQVYSKASKDFQGNFPPVWCWGSPSGAALLRMGDIDPNITERDQENLMLEKVRRSHPHLTEPTIIDLQVLPSPKDVQNSFIKFRELCTPETVGQFWLQDNHFLSQMEASKWLHTVSVCLQVAADAVKEIEKGITVVLQEGDGRDMSAVVSSLVQLTLDPYWRSIVGFQSLIQKEWVALGHPFCKRLSFISGYENEQSPIFLVFLDCVWQLLQQFPSAFEFTETYLTTLWDSTLIGVFDTFLFDCEQDRKNAAQDSSNPLQLRCIWDWEEQFSAEDVALFKNPLFAISKLLDHKNPESHIPKLDQATPNYLRRNSLVKHISSHKRMSMPANFHGANNSMIKSSESPENIAYGHDTLPIQYGMKSLELWKQCYFRWLPVLEVIGGGQPQVNFQTHILVEEITYLQQKLVAMQKGSMPPSPSFDLFNDPPFSCDRSRLKTYLKSNPNSFFPFSRGRPADQCQEAISNSIELMLQNCFLDDMFDSQSLLNAPD
ncbi:myotubularin-related protein 10-B [Ischnura elegans]|uniref:myotubularin-related protein 10-B n=1 Tax=Ischnura elegans TaxID=197161 RepID=UPI001ED88A72|nr:myotubularin-related protein 10-B [Ischnura elegans]